MTLAQVFAREAKQNAARLRKLGVNAEANGSTVRVLGPVKERDLHEEIAAEIRARGWISFHGSMAHATKRTIGEPDFTILADGGRVFLIEAKTRLGKLTQAQVNLHHWAEKLGHRVRIVRSLPEFLLVIEGGLIT